MKVLSLDCGTKKTLTEQEKKEGYYINTKGAVYNKHKIPCARGVCPTCGKSFWAGKRYRKTNPLNQQIFCSRNCFYKSDEYKPPAKKGKENSNWKGGVCLSYGYEICTFGDNSMKPIHRIVVEEVLGRELKRSEVVHHINGNKRDNRNKNLIVCTVAYHSFIHNRMAKLYQKEHFGGI